MDSEFSFPVAMKLIHGAGRWRLVFSDGDRAKEFEIFAFNENGWLVGWHRGELTYRIGFDGRALVTYYAQTEVGRFLRTRILEEAELAAEMCRVRAALERWRQSDGYEEPRPLLSVAPEDIATKFKQIWGRVAILPPDQYAAAVVRLTQGCAYNRCRFCSFYKNVPYRIVEPKEFQDNLQAVGDFFADELKERRGIFLAAANAANIADDKLAEALRLIEAEVRLNPQWERCWSYGAYSFLDTFSHKGRTVEQWRSLRELGLRGLYLGVETGSAPLRRLWCKPGNGDDIVALVDRLKEAGLNVGVIVLSGSEAEFLDNGHNAATLDLLNRLPLDGTDKIYISEYQPEREWESDSEYVAYRADCRRYTEEIMAGLRFFAYPQGPVVSLYDVWQFCY